MYNFVSTTSDVSEDGISTLDQAVVLPPLLELSAGGAIFGQRRTWSNVDCSSRKETRPFFSRGGGAPTKKGKKFEGSF